MDLDIKYVRKQFPAFDVPDLINKGFFENAGGSYVCRQVINRLNRFYTEKKYNPMVHLKPVSPVVMKWMRQELDLPAIWVSKNRK